MEKAHPNLVPILGGGFDDTTGNHYIVMDFIDGPNLKSALQSVPVKNIPKLIAQLASAAKFLEDLGYCHRDIKPENIALVEDYDKLILLDLGVIRPLKGSDITDQDGIHAFIGTLQYSSPEFLLREEVDTVEGWRAVTLYQIGAVLHDMIMRKALFDDFSQPYARLVEAVLNVTPSIQNSAIPYEILHIARSCLLKNWETRLSFVSWNSFSDLAVESKTIGSARQRVTLRATIARAEQAQSDSRSSSTASRPELKNFKDEVLNRLKSTARSLRSENDVLPPVKIVNSFPNEDGFGVQFLSAPDFGFAEPLSVFFLLEIVDFVENAVAISSCACFGQFAKDDGIGCEMTIVFKGVYDAKAVDDAVTERIYAFIDKMQLLSPNVDKFPVWLDSKG